jgi:uncharacterized protein YecE (DUF72 family)
LRSQFGHGESTLARYATRFDCLEINSSFHRKHRPETWVRWAESVPEGFQFSVKLAKTITHNARLVDCDGLIADFVEEIAGLGDKLAVILVQLPPTLAFDEAVAAPFFKALEASVDAHIACEPRHASWFEDEPNAWLADARIARVAADPARVPQAAHPGGWTDLAYWRLHGSPQIYRSSYEEATIAAYADQIADSPGEAWCIFDNTASSAATANALSLLERAAGGRV